MELDDLQEQIQDMQQRVAQMSARALPSQQPLLGRMAAAIEELKLANRELHASVGERSILTHADDRRESDEGSLEITERQVLTEALQAQADFLQTVIDTNPSCISVRDAQGKYVLVNQALTELYGLPTEQIIGRTIAQLFPNRELAEVADAQNQQVLTTGVTLFIPAKAYRIPTGEERWFQTIKKPLRSQQGRIEYILNVSTDVTELKQAQQTLQAQKDFLQTVIDTNPSHIFVKDSQGKYILVNQALAEFYGVTVEEMLGQTVADSPLTSTLIEQVQREDQAVLNALQPLAISEKTVTKATGEVHCFQGIKKPLLSPDGQTCLLGVGTDITELKQAQEALQAQRDFLQTVIDTNPNLIYVKDRKGKVLLANQACADFYGTTVEDLVGKSYEEAHTNLNLDRAEAERYISQDQEVFTTQQQTFVAEEACSSPTGEMRWYQTIKKPLFSNNGQVHQVLGVSTDITERKQAEEVQRQTQARLQRLVEANLIGVIFADFSGNITEANDTFLQMVGYTREELYAGKVRWLDMTPPEYAEDDAKARQQIRLTGACTPHAKEYIRKDGSRVPVLIGSALLAGSDGDCVCFVLDLTWRKQAEQQIRESLREKELLLQEIHHRVKNNLQIISSLLDLQSSFIKEPTLLSIFQTSCHRVKSIALVHENLYRSKNFANVNFIEYVEMLIHHLFQVYGMNSDRITLEREFDEVMLSIDIAIPCGLIVNELVSNALKYAFPNSTQGTIYIALHVNEDDYYTLTVRDNGIGLPFDLNIEAVESLGLQLVKILTEQLGGKLELNRCFGTEFQLRFPANTQIFQEN